MGAKAAMVVAVVVVMMVVAAGEKVKRQVYYSDAAPAPRPRPRPHYQEPHSSSSYESEENSIPGEPGVDYPIYHKVPNTKFTCDDVPYRPGIYSNPEAGCQVYHVCDDNRYGPQGAQFLCTNGTVFNQEVFTCDWWYNVDCSQATSLYSLNADPERNPYYQKPYEGPLNIPAPYGSSSEETYHRPAPYGSSSEETYHRPAPPRNYYQ